VIKNEWLFFSPLAAIELVHSLVLRR